MCSTKSYIKMLHRNVEKFGLHENLLELFKTKEERRLFKKLFKLVCLFAEFRR